MPVKEGGGDALNDKSPDHRSIVPCRWAPIMHGPHSRFLWLTLTYREARPTCGCQVLDVCSRLLAFSLILTMSRKGVFIPFRDFTRLFSSIDRTISTTNSRSTLEHLMQWLVSSWAMVAGRVSGAVGQS